MDTQGNLTVATPGCGRTRWLALLLSVSALLNVTFVLAGDVKKPVPSSKDQFDSMARDSTIMPDYMWATYKKLASAAELQDWGWQGSLREDDELGFSLLPIFRFRDEARRLLRLIGYEVWTRFPEDPRSWEWFEKTCRNPPSYATPQLSSLADAMDWGSGFPISGPRNTGAVVEWEKRYERSMKLGLASNAATRENMATAMFYHDGVWKIKEDAEKAKKGTSIEWNAWKELLVRFATLFPESQHAAQYGKYVATYMERYQKEGLAELYAQMRQSPNAALRQWANREIIFEEAKRTPIEMRFTAMNGSTVDLRDLRGKAVLIDFGAYTWCGVCAQERPLVKKLYEKYRNQGLALITIAGELENTTPQIVQRMMKDEGIDWPHQFSNKMTDNEFMNRYAITSVPEYFVLDKQGLLIWRRQQNPGGGAERLEGAIKEALGLPSTKDTGGDAKSRPSS